jgi:outer membrane receptor protein involved in Fe transport
MIRLLLLVLSIPFMASAVTSEGVVRGRIFDKTTNSGLEGVNIILRRDLGTISGPDGVYMLKTGEGNTEITFRYLGYKPVTTSINVIASDTLVLNVGLEVEVSELDQVVVSASRIEQRLSELTVSMSVIKPEFLASRHITDAQELINKTSGIEVLDGQASIRGGSGFSYGAGSRVLALIDGLPIMSADAGNVRWQFLPLDNISQVEIIKGASSVVYGSSAVNGIINFRTADASSTPVTRFYAESGFFDTPANQQWKWWDTPRIFSSASVSHLQRAGRTDIGAGLHLMADNGYRKLNDEMLARANIRVKHRSESIEGMSFGVNINAGTTEKYDFLLWENAVTGALKHNESTAIELKSNFLTIDPFITYRLDERFKHELRGRLQSSENRFPESVQNNSSATNFYAEYQFWNRLSDIITLNTGISENFSRINSEFYGDHKAFSLGAFAQLDIEPVSRLKISSGVRLEYISQDGTSENPVPLFRAGLNFKAADYTFLRTSFGQGYRFPSIAEKFASTTLGAVKIYPSPNIGPERGWNSEIGIKQGISTAYFQGQIDLAFFYSENTDMIEYLFGNYTDPVDGTPGVGFKAHNVEASRVYGFEIEYTLNKAIGRITNTINGGYVFMYPSEFNTYTGKNTGTMLKYRRKHSGNLNILSTYKKLDLGVSFTAKSRILNIDDVFLNPLTREAILPGFFDYWNSHNKAYLIVDLQSGYRILNNYTLSLVVKNITNTEYMGRPGDIQPHRNYSLRISGTF